MIRGFSMLTGLPPATVSTSGDGAAIDLQAYAAPGHREIMARLNCGTITGTTGTLDITIQESTTTGSGWGAVAGTTAFTQLSTTTGGETVFFRASKRYIRFVKTTGGTSPSFVAGVEVLVQNRLS